MRSTTLCAALSCAAAIAATATPALAASNGGTSFGGGEPAVFTPGNLTNDPTLPPDGSGPSAPSTQSAVLAHGVAQASADAPPAVRRAIAAANQIRHKPYIWGGGHASFRARGYDCSGAVSYVLHAAGLLGSPEVSGALAHWGARGPGRWITVYANAGHAFMVIAGLRFDTSGIGASGPRWRAEQRWLRGFARRHPAGL